MIPLLVIGRAMRRSHARRNVLVALDHLRSAYVAQIAERSRVPPHRVDAVLHGKLPGFRLELSLIALGLVTKGAPTSEGTAYDITPRGQLIVKSLTRGGLKLLVDGPTFPPLDDVPRDSASRPTQRVDLAAGPDMCPTCGRPASAA